jgi:hypothetical protein
MSSAGRGTDPGRERTRRERSRRLESLNLETNDACCLRVSYMVMGFLHLDDKLDLGRSYSPLQVIGWSLPSSFEGTKTCSPTVRDPSQIERSSAVGPPH